ncbi:MAG: hypothetical protein ILO36_06750 [Abditibacteriota bacterium]|nr:hypothetical protein [Abditibacteriota bacterium]
MTLLICVFAAVISTVLWYSREGCRIMKTAVLCWMFWGASLMWLIDAVFEYRELGAEFFTPAVSDMLNDAFLGVSVVALGLVIWLAVVLIADPKGTVKAALKK